MSDWWKQAAWSMAAIGFSVSSYQFLSEESGGWAMITVMAVFYCCCRSLGIAIQKHKRRD